MTLPHGVSLHPLATHADGRGTFTEIFRDEWGLGVRPLQWNVVRSEGAVMRGVHVHVRHTDLLTVVDGRATIGLRDLRTRSPTSGLAASVELRGDAMAAMVIPPGVAHGFYFHEPSLHVYAVTEYWAPEEEMGCHWADPALGIAWPAGPADVSERDDAAGSLAELEARLAPWQDALAVYPSSSSSPASSSTGTPSRSAFSSFDPGESPATT